MGKTKKSAKNSDFQKVKLKAGRVLKKSKNDFSAVNIKSKKIFLDPQFLKFASEAELVGAPAVLKELDHHNHRSRKIALNKIKTSLDNGEFSSHDLDLVITRVLSVLSDPYENVRNQALNVTKSLLQSLSSFEMKGISKPVESYASLVMTHVNPEIRHDSLKFFELLLDLFPEFVSSSSKLMMLFLELITSCKDKSKESCLLRIMPLKAQASAAEWKMSALKCVEKLLDALLRSQEIKEESIHYPCLAEATSMQIVVNARHLKDKYLISDTYKVSFDDDIKNFLCTLIRALSQSYKEEASCISRSSFESDSVAERHQFINITVKCLSMSSRFINVLEKTESHKKMVTVIKESIFESVHSCLFSSFPMIFDKTFLKKKKDPKSSDMSVTLNIELCNVFSLLLLDDQKCSFTLVTSISNFLLNIIKNQDAIKVDEMKIRILKNFLLSKAFDNETWEPFFKAMLDNCKLESSSNQYRQLVYSFFLDLCVDHKFKALCECETLQLWLSELPRELLLMFRNDVDEEHYRKVMALDIAALPALLNGLQNVASEYIDLLTSPNKYVKSIAMVMVSNVPELSNRNFFQIASLGLNFDIPFVPVKKLIIMLDARFRSYKYPGFSSLKYKSFLLYLAAGTQPGSDLFLLKNDDNVSRAICDVIPSGLCQYKIMSNLQVNKHKEVSNFALGLLEQLDEKYQVADSAKTMLLEMTTECEYMPTYIALSCLKIFSMFLKDRPQPCEKYNILCRNIASVTVGLYLYEIGLRKIDLQDGQLESFSVKKEFCHLLFNFGEIVEVMLSRLEHIGSLENTAYYGIILCDLKDRCVLPPEDMPRLRGLVEGFKAVYGGKIICSQPWYKRLAEYPAT